LDATGNLEMSRFHTLLDGRTPQGLGFGVGLGVAGNGVAVATGEAAAEAASDGPAEPDAMGLSAVRSDASAVAPEPIALVSANGPAGVGPEPEDPEFDPPSNVQAATAAISATAPMPAIEAGPLLTLCMRRS
jgi:hypothetical protein